LQHLGIDKDNRHCIYEKKLKRKYVTRQGLKALEDFIRTRPQEALQAFGSKESIARYGTKNLGMSDAVTTNSSTPSAHPGSGLLPTRLG
jgi:hypothetical protein